MKNTRFFSFYRVVCLISFSCLSLPLLIQCIRVGGFAGLLWLEGALLAGSAVLLMLPVFDEYVRPSLYYAFAALAVCLGGVLAGLPVRAWVLAVLAVHWLCLLRRCLRL